MKNNVVVTLTSSPEGNVTGQLNILPELTLRSGSPADIKAILAARAIKTFAFMGAREGVHCSFPMTVGDLIAVAPLADDAEQVIFLAQLRDNCTLASESHSLRDSPSERRVPRKLHEGIADVPAFRRAAERAGWTEDVIDCALEDVRLAYAPLLK